MMKRILSGILLLSVLLLAGCGGQTAASTPAPAATPSTAPTPAPTPTPEPTPKPTPGPGDGPQTGDESHLTLYIVCMAVSGLALLLLGVLNRNQKHEKK